MNLKWEGFQQIIVRATIRVGTRPCALEFPYLLHFHIYARYIELIARRKKSKSHKLDWDLE